MALADRPLITQVSRFDPLKDPLGVVAADRLARENVPALQLALVASMALDDPKGWHVALPSRMACGALGRRQTENDDGAHG